MTHLSIVIPAYNEGQRLGPTLAEIQRWCTQQPFDSEIVVVDDGSGDDTCELVLSTAAQDPRVRLVKNPCNRGKGYSVGHGVQESTGEWVLISDADLSTPIQEFHKLMDAIDAGADIAIGSRALASSELRERQPFYREAMGRTFNHIVSRAVFSGIQDTQCGFKLFRRSDAVALFSQRRVDGWAFDVEILYLARVAGLSIAEVPVVWVNDEASKVSPIRDSLQMFRDVMRIRWMHRHAGSPTANDR